MQQNSPAFPPIVTLLAGTIVPPSSFAPLMIGDPTGNGGDALIEIIGNDSPGNMFFWQHQGGALFPSATGFDIVINPQDSIVWLTGDLNNDGQDEILQIWSNGSYAGMTVYGMYNSTLILLGNYPQTGPLTTTGWMLADIDGDGALEIIQPWATEGNLAMNIWKLNGGFMSLWWQSMNLGVQLTDNMQWLAGDITGTGSSSLILISGDPEQYFTVFGWSNVTGLGMIGQSVVWSGDTLAFRIGDVNGDGKSEIIQPMRTPGVLAMVVYGWNGVSLQAIWETNDIGQGPGNTGWLLTDLNGDGQLELVQPWDNSGSLALIVYGWVNGGMTTLWMTSDTGEGPGNLGWLTGDIMGNGLSQIIQPWTDGNNIGVLVYGQQPG
jgi:hypothetical protein